MKIVPDSISSLAEVYHIDQKRYYIPAIHNNRKHDVKKTAAKIQNDHRKVSW